MPPEGSDFLAAVRPGKSAPDAPARAAGSKPSLGRRMFRTLIIGLIGVGATLAWQYYGDEAKMMVGTLAPSLGPFLSVATVKPPLDGQGPAPNAARAPTMAVAQNPAPATPTAPANSATPELVQQRLDAMMGDLAAVRSSLEQLAAKQEQMAQNIAALQAAEQDIKQKLSSAPASQAVPVPRHKPPHVAGPSAAPSSSVQSSSVPPPQRSAAPSPAAQPSAAQPSSSPQAPPPAPVPLH